jgi:hypothetical protein
MYRGAFQNTEQGHPKVLIKVDIEVPHKSNLAQGTLTLGELKSHFN